MPSQAAKPASDSVSDPSIETDLVSVIFARVAVLEKAVSALEKAMLRLADQVTPKVIARLAEDEGAELAPYLSGIEMRVMALAVEGNTSKQIADSLGLTYAVVGNCLHEIYEKSHCSGRVQLTSLVRRSPVLTKIIEELAPHATSAA